MLGVVDQLERAVALTMIEKSFLSNRFKRFTYEGISFDFISGL